MLLVRDEDQRIYGLGQEYRGDRRSGGVLHFPCLATIQFSGYAGVSSGQATQLSRRRCCLTRPTRAFRVKPEQKRHTQFQFSVSEVFFHPVQHHSVPSPRFGVVPGPLPVQYRAHTYLDRIVLCPVSMPASEVQGPLDFASTSSMTYSIPGDQLLPVSRTRSQPAGESSQGPSYGRRTQSESALDVSNVPMPVLRSPLTADNAVSSSVGLADRALLTVFYCPPGSGATKRYRRITFHSPSPGTNRLCTFTRPHRDNPHRPHTRRNRRRHPTIGHQSTRLCMRAIPRRTVCARTI